MQICCYFRVSFAGKGGNQSSRDPAWFWVRSGLGLLLERAWGKLLSSCNLQLQLLAHACDSRGSERGLWSLRHDQAPASPTLDLWGNLSAGEAAPTDTAVAITGGWRVSGSVCAVGTTATEGHHCGQRSSKRDGEGSPQATAALCLF